MKCDACGKEYLGLFGERGYKGPKFIAHTTHNSRRRCKHCGCPIPKDRDIVWRVYNRIFDVYDI